MRLDVRDLAVRAGDLLVIDGLDVAVGHGSFVGLVGPNGSGKSTLLKAIATVLRPVRGVVELDAADVRAMSARDVARALAVVAQETPTEIELTVLEMVMLGRLPHHRSFGGASSEDTGIAVGAMDTTGVAHLADRSWSTLSGGEKQRALLARALTQSTPVLLLDEPTNHLDIRHQLELLATARDLGTTAVAALHDLNLAARYCDEVVVLDGGAVVAVGPPARVLVDEVLAPVFGVHVDAVAHPRTGERQLVFSPMPVPHDPEPRLDVP